MDNTYTGIMLVVFLVIAALAIDIGYMYVSEEDLQNAAGASAIAGAHAIQQRVRNQIQTDPKRLKDVVNDQVQAAARGAAGAASLAAGFSVSLGLPPPPPPMPKATGGAAARMAASAG